MDVAAAGTAVPGAGGCEAQALKNKIRQMTDLRILKPGVFACGQCGGYEALGNGVQFTKSVLGGALMDKGGRPVRRAQPDFTSRFLAR